MSTRKAYSEGERAQVLGALNDYHIYTFLCETTARGDEYEEFLKQPESVQKVLYLALNERAETHCTRINVYCIPQGTDREHFVTAMTDYGVLYPYTENLERFLVEELRSAHWWSLAFFHISPTVHLPFFR